MTDTEDKYVELIKFLHRLGFKESGRFVWTNENIMIYFRGNYNEWRIMDTTTTHGMDLTSFKIPLNSEEKKRIWKTVSDNYKG